MVWTDFGQSVIGGFLMYDLTSCFFRDGKFSEDALRIRSADLEAGKMIKDGKLTTENNPIIRVARASQEYTLVAFVVEAAAWGFLLTLGGAQVTLTFWVCAVIGLRRASYAANFNNLDILINYRHNFWRDLVFIATIILLLISFRFFPINFN